MFFFGFIWFNVLTIAYPKLIIKTPRTKVIKKLLANILKKLRQLMKRQTLNYLEAKANKTVYSTKYCSPRSSVKSV